MRFKINASFKNEDVTQLGWRPKWELGRICTTLCHFRSSPISEEPKDWKISLKGLDSLWINRNGKFKKEPDVK